MKYKVLKKRKEEARKSKASRFSPAKKKKSKALLPYFAKKKGRKTKSLRKRKKPKALRFLYAKKKKHGKTKVLSKKSFNKEFREELYVIISITAVILVISFALGVVGATEAVLNGINPSSGMVSLSFNKTDENSAVNESLEPILVKNGTTWQLRKLRLR